MIIYLTTKPIVENVDNNNNGCNNNTQTNESQDNLKENDPYDKYKRDDF